MPAKNLGIPELRGELSGQGATGGLKGVGFSGRRFALGSICHCRSP